MATNDNGIPKMATDCKELFSIFMKIGGKFLSDFEKNEGYLRPQNVSCNNLHEIHDKLREFQHAHRYYPLYDDIIQINMRKTQIEPPKIVYDSTQDIRNMKFIVKFEKDGRY